MNGVWSTLVVKECEELEEDEEEALVVIVEETMPGSERDCVG
jgi:hypothetical protein